MQGATTKIDTGFVRKMRQYLYCAFACVVAALAFRAFALTGNRSREALQAYQAAQHVYQSVPQAGSNAWQFARTCFDLADFATNNTERADIAQQGIDAARRAIADQPDSGPAHYYLGLNLGQLARTKSLGALRLVSQMEREFLEAIHLDEHFDYAGAERSLGLLYRDAPSIASIGSRSKARQHLQRAVQLAPEYPENRLNLIESDVKWNDRNAARHELTELEAVWPQAHKQFSGPAWAASWEDWESRMADSRKVLGESPKPLETPRH
jgi:tetratricopeptide (TPR) repeat protein